MARVCWTSTDLNVLATVASVVRSGLAVRALYSDRFCSGFISCLCQFDSRGGLVVRTCWTTTNPNVLATVASVVHSGLAVRTLYFLPFTFRVHILFVSVGQSWWSSG